MGTDDLGNMVDGGGTLNGFVQGDTGDPFDEKLAAQDCVQLAYTFPNKYCGLSCVFPLQKFVQKDLLYGRRNIEVFWKVLLVQLLLKVARGILDIAVALVLQCRYQIRHGI